MKIEHINPKGVFDHPAFTRVITVENPGKLIYISGTGPADESGKCVSPGDYRAQYIKVMESLETQLKAAGATWSDVVYKRAYVVDIDAHIKAIHTIDAPRFGDPKSPPPAATLIGVTRLIDPDFLLEIELLAIVK